MLPNIALNAHLLSAETGYRRAGIHGYIRQLLDHLPGVDPGWRYTVLLGEGTSPDHPALNVRRSRLRTSNPLCRIVWEQLAQPWQLNGFDLVHELAFVAPLIMPRPFVVTVYDLTFLRYPERLPRARRWYLRLLTRLSCQRARRVLAISQSTADDLVALLGIPRSRIDLAIPGIDPRFCPLPAGEVAQWRQRQGLPDRFLLFVGTLEPRKNLPVLLRAYAALSPAERAACHLILAGGKGWMADEIDRTIEQYGLSDTVHRPGFVADDHLVWWYNAAEAFVYPSVFEGWGMPVTEAMACGKPVIVSDVSSLPEAVGDTGLRVPPGDVAAWTAALARCLNDAAWRAEKGRAPKNGQRVSPGNRPPRKPSPAIAKRWGSTMRRDWSVVFRRAMPFIDGLLILIAFRLAYTLRYDLQIPTPVGEDVRATAAFADFLPYAVLYAVWLIGMGPVAGLYRERRGRSWFEEVYGLINGATNATVVVMALNFLLRPQVFSRLMILELTTLVIVFLSVERLIYRYVRGGLRKRGIGVERVLIVGAGDVGRTVLSALLARPDLGYAPVGYLDDRPERGQANMGRVRGLGDLDQLEPLLETFAADLVIITLPWTARQKIMDMVAVCEYYGVAARVVPDLFQLNMSQVNVENLEGVPLLGLSTKIRMNPTKQLIKRVIDVTLVILSAPISLPLGLVAALAIKLDSPGPIFFRHRRVGKDGHEFDMIKFRSMSKDADRMRDELIRQTGADPKRPKWENDPRITRAGKWLRRTSIDELPQLLNVLRGEMSIVGPRPPTPAEVRHYETWHRQRLNTLPGVTSLWQVSGRSKVPFEEQCLLDIYYIENWSIALDIQIMLRTIPNVLIGTGAY